MIETALYTMLTEASTVKALVSTRVYPVEAVQNPTLPYLVYLKISSGRRDLSHSGSIRCAETEFQINCVASTVSGAKTLASAVVFSLHAYKGTVGAEKVFYCQVVNESDLLDDELGAYIVAVDVALLHKE